MKTTTKPKEVNISIDEEVPTITNFLKRANLLLLLDKLGIDVGEIFR